MNPLEKFWPRVDASGDCWLWTGGKDHYGYGAISINGKMVKAHRYSYQVAYGSIPEGLVLDHLCRTPACVNPTHLEAVTQAVNLQRAREANGLKPHCKNGHEFTYENTRQAKKQRVCRTCKRNNYKAASVSKKSAPIPLDTRQGATQHTQQHI